MTVHLYKFAEFEDGHLETVCGLDSDTVSMTWEPSEVTCADCVVS